MRQNPASAAQPQSCKTIWRPKLASIAPITIDESSKGRTLWPHHNSQRRHASILICKSCAFIQAFEEFLPDVRCHHFFGIQYRRHDSALEPGQTRVGITPTNLMPSRSSGFHTTKIPQQIHQSIRANRHPMRFRLQKISKYLYLVGSNHMLACSYNLGSKNEFDLAHLRGRNACMRGRSLLTPLGQPRI